MSKQRYEKDSREIAEIHRRLRKAMLKKSEQRTNPAPSVG